MEKERLLEAPSIGMLSVLPNDADHPESEGSTKRRWRRSTFACLNRKMFIEALKVLFYRVTKQLVQNLPLTLM